MKHNNFPPILVIGDIMLDIFSYGEVRRLNPEWPNPLINITHETKKLGGAANVAANITWLRTSCHLIGCIGNDVHGQITQSLLQEHNITFLPIPSDIPTIVKQRFIESTYHQQMIRADYEQLSPINAQQATEIIYQTIMENDYKIIILSDYNKWMLTPEIFSHISRLAKQKNIKVLVDAKPKNYHFIKDVFLIKPNFKEFSELIWAEIHNTDHDIEKHGIPLAREKQSNMIITRWSQWATLITQSGDILHIPTQAKQIFDVTGAGDTFIATVAMALNNGKTLTEAIKLGNTASGIIVGKIGTEIISYDELFSHD